MSNRCARPLAAIATIVFWSMTGHAQSPVVPLIRGEIQSDSRLSFMEYRVELEDLVRHGESFRGDIRLDGAFEFRHVPAGEYLLRLTAANGETVQQEFVTVNPQMGPLSMRIAGRAKAPSAPGTVSLRQLLHPPDRKAFHAFAAAQRLSAAGSPDKAAEELQKAVRISPEFADAYTNLAVQHIRMRRFAEALEEQSRAIEIAGPDPMRLCNLAFAQINLDRLPDALLSVRAALRLDASYPQAHLIAGSILAGDPDAREEAVAHLRIAAKSIPAARKLLEKLAGE